MSKRNEEACREKKLRERTRVRRSLDSWRGEVELVVVTPTAVHEFSFGPASGNAGLRAASVRSNTGERNATLRERVLWDRTRGADPIFMLAYAIILTRSFSHSPDVAHE